MRTLAVTLLITGSVLAGQSAPQLAWKEFSIGPATRNRTGFGAEGLRAEGIPFKRAIARAWGVPEFRISGPEWLDTQRYAITALVADPQEFQPLFQQELTKRFQLVTHWESRELSIFTLKQIDGVPHKLAAHTEGSPASSNGGPSSSSGGLSSRINLPNSTLGQFTNLLADVTNRPVFNETGLSGRFDFAVSWSTPSDDKVIAAIRDQLGLQLIVGKKNLDVLVVDHAEKLVFP
jgi:uncharacterized protein (TIGR03435 family)